MMYNLPTVEDSRGYIAFSNEGMYFYQTMLLKWLVGFL